MIFIALSLGLTSLVFIIIFSRLIIATINDQKFKKDKRKSFAELLRYGSIIEDGIILGKDGSLSASYAYICDDNDSTTDEEKNAIASRINALFVQLGDGWVFQLDSIRKETDSYSERYCSSFPNRVSRAIDEERRRYFSQLGNVYETEFVLTITYLPPTLTQHKFISLMYETTEEEKNKSNDFTKEILEKFKNTLSDIESQLSLTMSLDRLRSFSYQDEDGKTITFDRQLAFINYCITGIYHPIRLPDNPIFLDQILASQDFYVGTIPSIGNKYIKVIAIDGFPMESYMGILNNISKVSCSCRWNTRYIFLDSYTAQGQINKYQKKWKQKVRGLLAQVFNLPSSKIDHDALDMANDAEEMYSEVSSGLVGCGYYTSNIILMSEDYKELDINAHYIVKCINNIGFTARIESANSVDAYLGSLPQNTSNNIRKPLLHTLNLTHLIPSSSIWTGRDYCPCPFYPTNSPALMYCVTDGSSPFRLNLHVRDLGHTLILGPTGAGKSTLLATIAAQLQRYEGMSIFAFDKGMSMYALCKACDGSHYEIGADDSSLQFCPLAHLETAADQEWATNFISSILTLNNINETGIVTPLQIQAIKQALKSMSDNNEKTLSSFYSSIQDTDIRLILDNYIGYSAMGKILDGEKDSIELSKFTVFEMEEILNHPDKNRIPILLYLFKKIQDSLKGQPSVIILDEAWIMLSNPVFREKIREWLKVLRKANCAVIMATQSMSDAANSGIMDVINESCPTRIFLPNATATNEDTSEMYHKFGLNDVQIQILANAVPKRDYYFVSSEGRRLFSLALQKLTLAFVAVSDKETIALIKELERKHGNAWVDEYLTIKGLNLNDYE